MANLQYHKIIDRLIYVLALAGIGLTLHIILWYGNSTSGTEDPLCTIGSNCLGVIANDPAPLGIPSAWWGLLFYAVIAISGVLIARDFGAWQRTFIKARASFVVLSWGYSLFLVLLQAFTIEGWCLLCMYSFSLVTLITGLIFFQLFKRASSRTFKSKLRSENIFQGAFAVMLFGIILFDYSLLPEDQGDQISSTRETELVPSICTYDAGSVPYDNLEQIIMDYDPILGSEDAPILVMEFLDPNCNHCKTVHPNIKALIEEFPDSVKIVIKPVPIVGGPTYSLDEIAALYYANDHGVFEEMLDLVFEHQSPSTGLSVDRLADFLGDLGLDESDFRRAVSGREYANYTVQTRRFFEGMGLTGVPSIIINNRRISSASRSLSCMKMFVEQGISEL
ncbi:MAG: thioredoxin domain-containing protein [Bacteroidetes bacterium]|nr:thioredoxin domain-containing protein [Bacteroidota bacterium]